MELVIFGRFHARLGQEEAVAAAIREVIVPTSGEPACIGVHAFRSIRDPLLFYIHSRWVDEAAFEWHATLAHTVRFVETMTPLIDHPFEATRARVME